jgi:hypothetical protein
MRVKNHLFQIYEGGTSKWLTKPLRAEIAMLNLFLMRASRLFTKKRDLKTNRRDALNAEKHANSRETTTATDIPTTGIKGG